MQQPSHDGPELFLMILSESDAVYAANKFIDYYTQFNRIDDYLRFVKKDRIRMRGLDLFLVQTVNFLMHLECIQMI